MLLGLILALAFSEAEAAPARQVPRPLPRPTAHTAPPGEVAPPRDAALVLPVEEVELVRDVSGKPRT